MNDTTNRGTKKCLERTKEEKKIDRREAMTKAGKYAIFTAAAMMNILTPKKAAAASELTSPSPPSGW